MPSLLLVLVVALCLAPATAFAGPALSVEQGFSQPDGTTFRASLHGDEDFHYVQAASGALVQKNPQDETWYYVVRTASGLALASRADAPAPADALVPSALAGDADRAAYAALGGAAFGGASRETGEVVALADIAAVQGASGEASSALGTASATTTLPLITIVIGFEQPEGTTIGWSADEQRYSTTYDWASQLYSGSYSLGSFFSTMSNGRFSWVPAVAETSEGGVGGNTSTTDVAGDGIIHVTLDRNHGDWKSPAGPAAADLRSVYVAALEQASSYIDFSAYDLNGDGKLEVTEAGLLFIVAGYEASGGASAPAMWALRWQLDSMDEADYSPVAIGDVSINSFVTIGETLYVEGEIPVQQMSVGTVAHELGHYLGLSDLYDTSGAAGNPEASVTEFPWKDYDVFGVSLMASGSWGRWVDDQGTLRFAPTSIDPCCLVMLGFIEPTTVDASGTYEVSTYWSDAGYQCLFIPTGNDSEFYLVENRQYESFDMGLRAFYLDGIEPDDDALYNPTGGIVVWHVDAGIVEARSVASTAELELRNTVNTTDHRPGIMPTYQEQTLLMDGLPLGGRPFYNAAACEQLDCDTLRLALYDGCALPSERVDSGIAITVNSAAADTMRVTVDLPDAAVTSIAPEDSTLGWEGGTVGFDVTGANLYGEVELHVYDEAGQRIADAWATAENDEWSSLSARTASLAFPANEGDAACEYEVRVAYAGEETAPSAKVVVGGRYERRALAAELGTVRVGVTGSFQAEDETAVVLSALTDEQMAQLAEASGQMGAFVVGVNVSVVNGMGESAAHSGPLVVTFSVDARLEGSEIWLAHRKADGALEVARDTVRNGMASMTVSGLSPFALFEVGAADDGAAAGSAASLPRSGDGPVALVAFGAFAAAALALAGAGVALRRRRK